MMQQNSERKTVDNMTMSELYANEISAAVQLMRNGVGRESSKSLVILHCSDLHKWKKNWIGFYNLQMKTSG